MIVMILMIVMKVGVCCFMSSCIIIICLNNIEEMWDAECTSDIEEFEGESPPSLPEQLAVYTKIAMYLDNNCVLISLSSDVLPIQ